MKTVKEFSDAEHREVNINVDALLAAINEICESEVRYEENQENPHQVGADGRRRHSYTELAEAFELDIHDFSVSEVNR